MSGIVLEFDCACGDFKVSSDKFPSYAAYRQITNVHRERCIKASRAAGESVLEQAAEPRANRARSVRQAADADGDQQWRRSASAATQLERIRGGFIFFVACPALWVAGIVSGVRGWL